MSQETLALHSSPAEPAAACSPSNTCYSSDAAAAVISHHSTRKYTEISVNKREMYKWEMLCKLISCCRCTKAGIPQYTPRFVHVAFFYCRPISFYQSLPGFCSWGKK